jgi:ABC-type antimicrobial peptide transport system permease subunit
LSIVKNKAGIISGFILGVGGFRLLFKLLFLDNIQPEDEPVPAIVFFASILNGFLFAFIGSLVQNYFVKKRNYKTN